MNLVSYRRTSGEQKESTSLESQKAKIEAKCLIDDHALVADFWDQESAETAEHRPGFQDALQFIYSGRADGLIVWKLDRFARSVLDGVRILAEFKGARKALVCVADPIDTTTAMGEAFFQISMVFAELERKTIAERCQAGVAARAAQLRYAGGAAPYGWRADKENGQKVLVVDADEQLVLLRIKTMREDEVMTYRAIAQALTNEGISPPYKNRKSQTKDWNNCTVRCLYIENRKLAHWAMSGYSYNYLDPQEAAS